ncbi:unnamed protein product, partial [Urochloa humidicola]
KYWRISTGWTHCSRGFVMLVNSNHFNKLKAPMDKEMVSDKIFGD